MNLSKVSDLISPLTVPSVKDSARSQNASGVEESTGVELDNGTKLSSLARQLSAAAERAAARDNQLSRKELGDLGSRILEEVGGRAYTFNKKLHDAFIPDTDDPELLARARQATDFLNGKDVNPFKDLSREQLALIFYDEAGEFTTNERVAARRELGERNSQWSRYIVDKGNAEYARTGYTDDMIREIIAYYKALPAIEEAQLIGDYETNLGMLIGKKDLPRSDDANTSLFDLIMKTVKELEDAEQARKPQIDPQAPDRLA